MAVVLKDREEMKGERNLALSKSNKQEDLIASLREKKIWYTKDIVIFLKKRKKKIRKDREWFVQKSRRSMNWNSLRIQTHLFSQH